MQSATVVLTDPVGLHARPAAELVQTAARYKADISLEHGSRKANAKSIIMVLALGARQGAAVEVKANGEDEFEAVAAIVKLLARNNEKGEERK
ncbi:MAG: HPr family phosphocarrier protein [Candidatus Chloroheliales bacterium]|nr:MAG: HPr family phosphocarrier protein [Chloroflexota bacterium]